jgi:hydroxymethylbilane synthase
VAVAFKIGTRGSPLALWQAFEVRRRLAAGNELPEAAVEITVIKTSGDLIQDRALSEAGGKGLFTREIDAALLDGSVDLAVHSAKDLPTLVPPGLIIAGYLPRADTRDAFISAKAKTLQDLPQGAVLGTASLRRQALARRLRPDLTVTLLRGNVETRLRKVESGEIDATLLALAGLQRLGLSHRIASLLDLQSFPPAVGQGAVAIMTRDTDAPVREALLPVTDRDTGIALAAERAFLAVLDGSCRTPIAGLADVRGDHLSLRGLLLRHDGSECYEAMRAGAAKDAVQLGAEAGHDILGRAPSDILAP